MATDYESQIPVEVSREVIQGVVADSAVIAVSKHVPMPAGVVSIPVASVAPTAGFVTPKYGGRKPVTQVEWTAEKLDPEEIACTLSIPNAFLDDSGFPVWENVRPLVATAIARAFDDAALNGAGAPASYPVGGLIAAAGAAVDGGTVSEAVDAALGELEELGFIADGLVGGAKLNGVMRGLMVGMSIMPTDAAPQRLWGLEFETTPEWDYAKGDALVGDFDLSLVGIREDIRFDLSTEGVLTDPAGKVLVNAFQDDSTLMRCYTRIAYAIGSPLATDGAAHAPFRLARLVEAGGAAARKVTK